MQVIFGKHPVLECILSGKEVDKILLNKQSKGFDDIINAARERDIFVQKVPLERINRVTRKNHQGVVALVAPIHYYNIEDVLPHVHEKGETPLFVVLDGITDVHNLGAIARSAECLGVHAIIVPQKGSAQINDQAIKASAGALNIIPVCKEKDIESAVKYLKLNGIKIYASDLKANKEIKEMDFKVPCAIIMGSEDFGVQHSVSKLADELFTIPMKGKIESFNVSVATGICLYQVALDRS